MKNFMFLLAAFLILLSNPAFGQNKVAISPVHHDQMDVVSLELMSFMGEILSDANLEELHKILAKGMDGLPESPGEVRIQLSFEMILTDQNTPITTEKPVPMASFDQQPPRLNDFGQPEMMRLNLNKKQSLFTNNDLINNICNSIVCLDNTSGWINLDKVDWKSDLEQKIKYQPKASTNGDWHFKVGPQEI